jgi:hypothetical protein
VNLSVAEHTPRANGDTRRAIGSIPVPLTIPINSLGYFRPNHRQTACRVESAAEPESIRAGIHSEDARVPTTTDAALRSTAAPGGPSLYACSTNYLIDGHVGVILDVETTAAQRAEETDATKAMIDPRSALILSARN